jgi:transposase-like protein
LTFFDFPAEHWIRLRTTNPIESPCATVKTRTRQTKGAGSRQAGLALAFKLALAAEKHWRKAAGGVCPTWSHCGALASSSKTELKSYPCKSRNMNSRQSCS